MSMQSQLQDYHNLPLSLIEAGKTKIEILIKVENTGFFKTWESQVNSTKHRF